MPSSFCYTPAMNTSLIAQEDHLRSLALSVARNKVGPDDPIEEVLARECVAPDEFDKLLEDPVFKRYVKDYVQELTDNGFSFQSKCRILAEDAVQSVYHIAKDPEAPAAARIKATENLVEWAKLHTPAALPTSSQPQFQITFNIPPGFTPGAASAITVNQVDASVPASITADFTPADMIDADYEEVDE